MCRVLGVSRSGFHAWERRPPSQRALVDARLGERIAAIHRRSRDSYGVRRVHLDLRDEGVRVGRERVARLMRQAGLSGYVKRRKGTTTIRVPGVRVASDLVGRDFNPQAPNRLWTSDIKYVSTWEGTLHLATVIDCYSRRVVGWAMRADMQAELVVDALEMAINRRRPQAGLVHHSDQGSQPELVVDALEMAINRRRPQAGLVHHSDQGSQPEFKGPSQRCRFTERIVVPWPAVLDPVMSGSSASPIAEAA
jgi:putative transposase